MADQMVTYTGGARRRTISQDEWVAAGVKEMPSVEWSQHLNGKKIPVASFTSDALDRLRGMPREFRIDGEENEQNVPRVVPGAHVGHRVTPPTPEDQIPDEEN